MAKRLDQKERCRQLRLELGLPDDHPDAERAEELLSRLIDQRALYILDTARRILQIAAPTSPAHD